MQEQVNTKVEEPWGKDFDSVSMNEDQVEAMEDARSLLQGCANNLQVILPSDTPKAARLRAMVKTKLEEASMLATKCISRGYQDS